MVSVFVSFRSGVGCDLGARNVLPVLVACMLRQYLKCKILTSNLVLLIAQYYTPYFLPVIVYVLILALHKMHINCIHTCSTTTLHLVSMNSTPSISFCFAIIPGNFQALNKRLLISNDSYMRTTSALHKETSQRLWKICADAGDIFLGKYEVSHSLTRSPTHGSNCTVVFAW